MELINFPVLKRRTAAAAFLLFCLGLSLYAQNPSPLVLAGEIETIGKTLQNPGVSAAAQRDALIRLARFLTLSGNIEGAADAWLKAAAAEPGKRDDMSLLKGARCLAALGQLEAAEEYVKNVLLTGDAGESQLEARCLGAQIQAFRTGNGAVMVSFLQNAEYADKRPSLLYTLWKVTGEEAYRVRLENEYPSSPEGRIVRSGLPEQVQGAPTAMWFLFPGREGLGEPVLGSGNAAAVGGIPRTGAVPARSIPVIPGAVQAAPGSPAEGPPANLPPAAVSPAAASPGGVLQTGLFSREENTQAMAERLRRGGFTPVVTRRTVNGTEYWAVGVSPGENMNDMILRLKNAGFESFPVYERD
jgi:hypothetical protein